MSRGSPITSAVAAECWKQAKDKRTRGFLLLWIALCALFSTAVSGRLILVSLGQILLLVWVGLAVGQEYDWGTHATVLVGGATTRVRLFLAKASLVFLGCTIQVIVFSASDLLSKHLAQGAGRTPAPVSCDARCLLGTLVSVASYGALGYLLSVLARSTYSALQLGALTFLGEWLLVGVLPLLRTGLSIIRPDWANAVVRMVTFVQDLCIRTNANLLVGFTDANLLPARTAGGWEASATFLAGVTALALAAGLSMATRQELTVEP
jgi:hypothetical protein